ncbi:TPA: integrating conjugative element protein [Pseudomonas aeruginosa]|uniref:integrating conjugative element protein n=1 Tax=Pseudomonas aeruginosa TaxID=287 RepID=UPI000FC3FD97|nr:integrating conjugative element protein [Pseudomonas aeruginosa]MDV8053302.1 integrating conjugative element protein [Pseudomonas aeruginosa]RUC57539.1 integrating conjugative element protein [Pseudomonas aeruginosa]
MRMNITSVALTWLLAAQLAQADDPINVSKTGTVLSDEVLYSIGGGSAVSMGSAGQMDSIGVGFGWNNDMMCGNMNLSTTLENQLNGATQGFQNIMGSVIQNATGAVMSLPALIIQRANPQLYNLITNGILQARIDYDRSKGTCRAIAEKMADIAGEQTGWGKIAEGQALGATLASDGKDAVSALEAVEKKGGNDGVTWVGGDKAGGSGQKPIRIVNDVTRAGYNLLTSRSVNDSSSVPSATCNNGLVCNTWSSPQEAAAFATRVLGEQQQQTCEGCQKTVTAAGVGLTPLIQETYDKKLQSLQELLSKSKPLTAENLAAAGTDALPITRGVIEALRDERDQDVLARRLASDVSLMEVLSKALLLQRLMFAGAKEPNVAANGLATQAVDQQTSLLQQEISNLKTELELRRELASNSPMRVIERGQQRASGSSGVFESAPDADRLDRLQAPSAAGGKSGGRP